MIVSKTEKKNTILHKQYIYCNSHILKKEKDVQ